MNMKINFRRNFVIGKTKTKICRRMFQRIRIKFDRYVTVTRPIKFTRMPKISHSFMYLQSTYLGRRRYVTSADKWQPRLFPVLQTLSEIVRQRDR